MGNMAPQMYAAVSNHKEHVDINKIDQTPGFKEWRITEDQLPDKEVVVKPVNGELPPLEKCFNIGLSVDTEKIYPASTKTKSMMLSFSETVMGALKQDTCAADIICVIDISGSMQGEKLRNVKTTLKYLVHVMEGSRLALVTFDDRADTLLNFKVIDAKNSPKILDIIDSLKERGSTNIAGAALHAQKLIGLRRSRNKVCSVFFLSDGQHNQGPISQEMMFDGDYSRANSEYTLHCFGYGDDHDAKLMQGMSQRKGGNYYFVHDVKRVDECFVDCLGTVTTALAESAMIRVNFKPSVHGAQLKIAKVSSHNTKLVSASTLEARMLTVYAGVQKDFMFDADFVAGTAKDGDVIEAEIFFEFNKLGAQELTNTTKTVRIEVAATTAEPPANNSNPNVAKNLLRVKSVEIFKAVMGLANGQTKDIAVSLLTGFEVELTKDPAIANDPLIKALIDVTVRAKTMLQSQIAGKPIEFKVDNYLVQQINSFENQSSTPLFEQQGLFCNEKQLQNLSTLKHDNKPTAKLR